MYIYTRSTLLGTSGRLHKNHRAQLRVWRKITATCDGSTMPMTRSHIHETNMFHGLKHDGLQTGIFLRSKPQTAFLAQPKCPQVTFLCREPPQIDGNLSVFHSPQCWVDTKAPCLQRPNTHMGAIKYHAMTMRHTHKHTLSNTHTHTRTLSRTHTDRDREKSVYTHACLCARE